MRKLPFILFGAIAAIVSIGAGQGCGDSTANTGGAGPGGGSPGGGGNATTQGTGGTTTPGTGGSSATVNPSSSGGSSPGTGGSTGTSGGGGGGGTQACTGVELTVHNIAAWCNVSVNGGTASTGLTQTVCIDTPGAVPLTAATTPGFVLSDTMWHHVDDSSGDTGVKGMWNGAMTKSSETKTVGANGTACAWVCCPGMGNPTECDVGGMFVPMDPCGP